MMIKLLIAATLLVAPASAEAPVRQPTSLGDVITICRITMFGDEAKGVAMYESLPAEEHKPAAAICIAYGQGVSDALELVAREKTAGNLS